MSLPTLLLQATTPVIATSLRPRAWAIHHYMLWPTEWTGPTASTCTPRPADSRRPRSRRQTTGWTWSSIRARATASWEPSPGPDQPALPSPLPVPPQPQPQLTLPETTASPDWRTATTQLPPARQDSFTHPPARLSPLTERTSPPSTSLPCNCLTLPEPSRGRVVQAPPLISQELPRRQPPPTALATTASPGCSTAPTQSLPARAASSLLRAARR